MRVLEPDPIRAPVIQAIFDDYVHRGLSIGDIVTKLNSDPERYPPPEAPRPDRSRGFWAKSTVWDLLHNPKYTGYQVWNRRARKRGGKHNPPEARIWSEEPAHEPLVSRDIFERATLKGVTNDNASRDPREAGATPTFLLRSFLRCGACGLRMPGHRARRGNHYYACEARRRPPGLSPEDHPRTVHLNEVKAAQKVIQFLNDYVFGVDRTNRLAQLLDGTDPDADQQKEEVQKLEKEVAAIDAKVRKLLSHLEQEESGSEAAEVYRARLRELASLQTRKERQLEGVRRELKRRPTLESAANLLELLPIMEIDTRRLTERDFRDLLEAFSLKAIYAPSSKQLTVEVALAPHVFPDTGPEKEGGSVPRKGSGPGARAAEYTGFVRAPDGFRTKPAHSSEPYMIWLRRTYSLEGTALDPRLITDRLGPSYGDSRGTITNLAWLAAIHSR